MLKKWWFWLIVVGILIMIIGNSGGSNESVSKEEKEIIYEVVDLQILLDDLESNAMKAESNYQKKYVEFTCKIVNFDSDGKYISVDPPYSSEWNLISTMCYIKNDAQKEFLIQKNIGDTITIKGQVTSIGEVLGYSVDIKEVE